MKGVSSFSPNKNWILLKIEKAILFLAYLAIIWASGVALLSVSSLIMFVFCLRMVSSKDLTDLAFMGLKIGRRKDIIVSLIIILVVLTINMAPYHYLQNRFLNNSLIQMDFLVPFFLHSLTNQHYKSTKNLFLTLYVGVCCQLMPIFLHPLEKVFGRN